MKHPIATFILASTAFTSFPALAEEIPASALPALRAAAGSLSTQLAGDLKRELAANGPESAIQVCRDKAPQIAGELSRNNGWKVTRVSLKARNPLLGMPDAWEQTALQKMQERLAAGEKPETLEVMEVVKEPAGRFLRYAKGMPTQTLCLTCHGAAAEMAPGLKAKIAAAYPRDAATGYTVGMLRGAVSIKQPLD
ncbi:MAG: DUF3365 domain-containing protein [Rhodocyclaceae bacterium]|nr:DUF3365 domain-containing protein [Rhodocyclaceae bacterium]